MSFHFAHAWSNQHHLGLKSLERDRVQIWENRLDLIEGFIEEEYPLDAQDEESGWCVFHD